jgi:hypothetical protein
VRFAYPEAQPAPASFFAPRTPHNMAEVLFSAGELAGVVAGDPRLRPRIDELKEVDPSMLDLSLRSPFSSLETLSMASRPAGRNGDVSIESERGRMCGVLATRAGLDASELAEASLQAEDMPDKTRTGCPCEALG